MDNRSNYQQRSTGLIPKAHVPGQLPKENKIFPKKSQEEIERLNKEKIFFSFQYLDIQHKAFNCGGVNDGWFLHVFENLSEVSKLTFSEFERQRQHYDIHRHDFQKTQFHYKDSRHLNEVILSQISPENIIQFRLSSSGGRVHGIRYHNMIYVIWLDPHHNMNPSQRHGGLDYFNAPLTPYQELEVECDSLKTKYKNLENEVEIIVSDNYDLKEKLEKCKEELEDCKKDLEDCKNSK